VILVSPFPAEAFPAVWTWLQEFPANNFDDYGPRTYETFQAAMQDRAAVERTWGVLHEGQPCGIIAYLPLSERLGIFHGICFAQSVHGKGIAKAAVRQVLDELFASGVFKVQAAFFADNLRVGRFLIGLGAVEEGLLRKQTMRDGIAIDMQLLAFFKE
jgi:RimJ/RimL family protein N-acetyltransferase